MADHKNSTNQPPDQQYDEAFFQHWIDRCKEQVRDQLPQINPSHQQFFVAACQHVQSQNDLLQKATEERDAIAKQKPVDQDALDKANQAVKDAQTALEQAQTDALQQSVPLLDDLEQHPVHHDTRKVLLVLQALLQATPKGLANYCQHQTLTQAQIDALIQLLQAQEDQQFALLEQMVLAGGAKKGQYGPALEIYTTLQAHVSVQKEPLLQRLAMAVALELADPLPEMFLDNKQFIDPIQRYLHYEQAWMFGELDPAFDTFNVWELRMAINSVAANDQLGWGRQMLMNYRPDIMALTDQWRYCRIVRTDVFYTGQPNWPTRPLDYPQILSGGGECGPRAWMGRFICRAFGIPVWGVREPGHAAMARWTADQGWIICLGAGMAYAWWDDQCGLYFQLQAAARKVCSKNNDPSQPNFAYGDKVMILEWIADMLEEPAESVMRHFLEDPKALWRSLALMQRKRLTQTPSTTPGDENPAVMALTRRVVPKLEHLWVKNFFQPTESIVTIDNGTIIIPAANYDPPTKPSDNVMVMDSFLGGKQLFLNKDGQVDYILNSVPGGKYQLTCKFVTVHDDKVKPPLLVTIDGTHNVSNDDHVPDLLGDDHNLCSVYSVPLPYTKGLWEETPLVAIEFPTKSATIKISLSREATAHGLVLKQLKFVPAK